MTLTAEQLSVVNLVSGRHLVLAPPGSGKTEMLSPDDSPKAVLETVRHLLGDNVAENVAILVRTNREADDCERLVRGLGYRTVKVSGRDLFAYPTMRMRKRFGRSS